MNIAKRATALVLAGLLAASMAACSKSDDSASSTTTSKVESSDKDETTTTKKSSSSDDESSSSGDSSSGDMNLGNLGDCLNISMAFVGIVGAPLAALGGQVTEADIEEYNQQMEDIKAELPEDVQDDMDIVAEAYGTYFEELSQVMNEGDLLSNADKLEELGKALEEPEVVQAQENIQNYIDETCGS